MRHSKELLINTESYSKKIGLDNRLIHIARTKLQADTLWSIQTDCEIKYNADYTNAKNRDPANPGREQSYAIDAIKLLKKHLYAHYIPSELEMISQLQQLEERLDIEHRWRKPQLSFDSAIVNIIKELEEADFSKTNIHENILPVFSAMIKSE